MTNEKKKAALNAEVPPPSWLTTELIQEALQNDGEKNCQVKKISFSLGTAPGDNYLSIIYRTKVELSNGKERVLFIKSQPEGEELQSYLKEADCFRREGEMMGNIIPRMQALLDEVAPGRWQPMAPRCPLYGSAPGFLVMEDLAQEGFRMAQRLRGLGIRHCLVALRTIARYHASSHALFKKDPALFEKLRTSFRSPMDSLLQFIEECILACAEACRSWPGFEEYAEPLEKIQPIIRDKYREYGNPKADAISCMAHGDFWTNNMMFRYDENGLPCDLRLVDLQIAHITSPAIDVIYFLGTSPQEIVSTHYEDLLIREYHYAFQEALTVLEIKAPTLEEFLSEMHAHRLSCVFAHFAAIPLLKSDKTADFDSAMKGDKAAIRVLFTMPLVKRWIQRVLPDLKQRGWLTI